MLTIPTVSHADASAGAPAPVEVEGFVRVGGDAAGEGSDYRARLLAVERRIQELELLEYEIAAMTPALSADLSLEAANDLAQYMAGRNAPGTAEPGSGEVGFESGETTLARRIRMTEELKLHTKIALDALVSGEDDGRIEAVRARVRAFKEAAYPTVVESVATENEEVTETHAGTGPSEAYQRELARWEVIRLTAKFEFLDGPSKEESEKQGRELRMSKVSSRIVGKITKWREARRQEKRARMLKQRAEWVRELDTLTKSQ